MLRMNVLLCIFLFFLGLLYNLTESYDCAFYFAASLFLMGGAVMALPVLKFHKAPGPPIHATRSTSTIETQTFSDEDKFLTDWFTVIPSVPYIFAFVFVLEYVKYRFLFSWWKKQVFSWCLQSNLFFTLGRHVMYLSHLNTSGMLEDTRQRTNFINYALGISVQKYRMRST